MKNVHPCTFFIDEICDERKSRFCMEPAASVPLLPVRLSSYGLLSSVRPCTLLNDKFFYRKTYCCLEPPPSVAVCGETEQAKCVGVECKTKNYTFCVYRMCKNLPCRYVYRRQHIRERLFFLSKKKKNLPLT